MYINKSKTGLGRIYKIHSDNEYLCRAHSGFWRLNSEQDRHLSFILAEHEQEEINQ